MTAAAPVLFTAIISGSILIATGLRTQPGQVAGASPPGLHLIVIGDSIPYGQGDCGYCTPFIELFGRALSRATGRRVSVANWADHTGIDSADLLHHLKDVSTLRQAVKRADGIVVTIGHNDPPWNNEHDPCDGNRTAPDVDWTKYDTACVAATAKVYRANLRGILRAVRALRQGKTTLVRVTDDYNDITGDPSLPRSAGSRAKLWYDTYSAITCKVAHAYGAMCIDTYHAFNGADGTQDAGRLLASDHTHPNAQGHQLIARLLIRAGFRPIYP